MLLVLYSSSNEEMLSSCGQTQTDTVYMLAATSCFLVTAKSASCSSEDADWIQLHSEPAENHSDCSFSKCTNENGKHFKL